MQNSPTSTKYFAKTDLSISAYTEIQPLLLSKVFTQMVSLNMNGIKFNFSTPQFIQYSLFLFLALLLCTPNFSVVIAVLLTGYSLFYFAKNIKTLGLSRSDWFIFAVFFCYFAANIPNVILDEGKFRYLEAPSKILLCFFVYLMFRVELKKIEIKPWIEYGAAFGAFGALAIAYIQHFHLGYHRVEGFLFSINFGYLACSLAFLNLSFLLDSPRKIWLCCGFIAAVIATILTLTRGAIFAIPVLSLLFIVLNRHRINKQILLYAFLAASVGFISSYSFSDSFKNRLDYTMAEFKNIASGNVAAAPSSGGRLQLWLIAKEAFKQSPILGLTYPEREKLAIKLHQEGKVSAWALTINRTHAHSQHFEMLASTGILGILTIIMMFLTPIGLLYKNRTQNFAVSGVIFIVGIMIFGATEVLLQANLISFYFGILLAFFLARLHIETVDLS